MLWGMVYFVRGLELYIDVFLLLYYLFESRIQTPSVQTLFTRIVIQESTHFSSGGRVIA